MIERLHKGCEASAMLLVENGLLDSTKIMSVSSKGTKGRVCKRVTDVPPNFAKYFLFLVLSLSILPGMIYGSRAYQALNNAYVKHQLQSSYKQGWTNLSNYYASDLRRSYSNQEFPVRFVRWQTHEKKKMTFTFEVYNKTAVPMTVYSKGKGEEKDDSLRMASVDLPPMSQKHLTVRAPAPSADSARPEIDFSFKVGEEFLYGITFDADLTRLEKNPQ
jgi:hypothetical protein